MIEGMDESMNELSESQREALIECLAALEAGADIEACLARRPEHAEILRPFLEFRARLLAVDIPAASPAAFQAGREALLERVTAEPVSRARWSPVHVRRPRLASPLAQIAAAVAVLILLAGGALGVSAGVGFEPSRDVLSVLPVIDLPPSNEGPPGGQGAVASPTQAGGDTPAAPGRDGVSGPRPEEIPGAGLCFAEGELPRATVPSGLLERVPDVGLCIPEELLQRSENGRSCVPEGVAQQLADIFADALGDLPVCGSPDAGQPPNGSDLHPTTEAPGGPPAAPTATAPPSGGPQGPGPMPTEDRGAPEGPSDGAPQGPSDGAPQGSPDGLSQGLSDGEPPDQPEGVLQGLLDGEPPDRPDGLSRDPPAH
jgi:hypothetical protein